MVYELEIEIDYIILTTYINHNHNNQSKVTIDLLITLPDRIEIFCNPPDQKRAQNFKSIWVRDEKVVFFDIHITKINCMIHRDDQSNNLKVISDLIIVIS